MLNWKKIAAVAAVVMGSAVAQPGLTTIQDVLYRADGSRFTGTVYITYQSFQSADTSNIATANLTVPVVNGSLRVRLVPTTTASAGAQYNITYNAAGINQFTETWAVPATGTTLRVRDVRIGNGSVIGPPPVVSPVQIGDVIGLALRRIHQNRSLTGFQIHLRDGHAHHTARQQTALGINGQTVYAFKV